MIAFPHRFFLWELRLAPWLQVRLGVSGQRWSGSEFGLWDAGGASVSKSRPKGPLNKENDEKQRPCTLW
jgi:hypothetical protein